MPHTSKSQPTISDPDLDRHINSRASAVHQMAHRFMQSPSEAAALATATLAWARTDPEAEAAKSGLDAYLFGVMHRIVLFRLHEKPFSSA